MYPRFWAGADPMEAWIFNLDPLRNPGDHSAIPALSRAELARELSAAAIHQPRSKWLRERTELLIAEQDERRRTP